MQSGQGPPKVSYSDGSLSESAMNSLPTATTPRPVDDTEVLSQRLPTMAEVALEAPQCGVPGVGLAGFKVRTDRVDESHGKPGSQSNTVPEPPTVPDLGGQPLVREGEPSVPGTSFMPEASDSLVEALRGASMDDEHRTLMSAVIQKVLSAKSGLTEACTSLLTGFEVSKKYVTLPPDR